MGQIEGTRGKPRRGAGRDPAASTRAESQPEAQAAEKVERVDAESPAAVLPADRPVAVAPEELIVPRGLYIAAAWTWRLLLFGIAIVALLWVVGRLQVVVVPIIIATLLSALLSPLVRLLRQAGVPRSLATTLVLIGGISAVGGTLYLVVNQLITGAPELADNAQAGLVKIQQWLKTGPLHLTDDQLNGLPTEVGDWFSDNRQALTTGALSTASTVGHVLTGIFLVLFITFFFLRDGRRISRFTIGLLPQGAQGPIIGAADMSWATLVSYVRATVLVAFIDAVGVGLALLILKVPFAFSLAALVFIGAFIPIVGATLSGAVAVLIALVDRGPVIALILLAAVIAVQQLEGHVLQPIIMGRAVAMHPLAVILAIAVGIVQAGIIGALVAVPVVAVLNTAIRYLVARPSLDAAAMTDSPELAPEAAP